MAEAMTAHARSKVPSVSDWSVDPNGSVQGTTSRAIMYQIPHGSRAVCAVVDEELDLLVLLRDRYLGKSREADNIGHGIQHWWEDPAAMEAHDRAMSAWNIYRAASDALGVSLTRFQPKE